MVAPLFWGEGVLEAPTVSALHFGAVQKDLNFAMAIMDVDYVLKSILA